MMVCRNMFSQLRIILSPCRKSASLLPSFTLSVRRTSSKSFSSDPLIILKRVISLIDSDPSKFNVLQAFDHLTVLRDLGYNIDVLSDKTICTTDTTLLKWKTTCIKIRKLPLTIDNLKAACNKSDKIPYLARAGYGYNQLRTLIFDLLEKYGMPPEMADEVILDMPGRRGLEQLGNYYHKIVTLLTFFKSTGTDIAQEIFVLHKLDLNKLISQHDEINKLGLRRMSHMFMFTELTPYTPISNKDSISKMVDEVYPTIRGHKDSEHLNVKQIACLRSVIKLLLRTQSASPAAQVLATYRYLLQTGFSANLINKCIPILFYRPDEILEVMAHPDTRELLSTFQNKQAKLNCTFVRLDLQNDWKVLFNVG